MELRFPPGAPGQEIRVELPDVSAETEPFVLELRRREGTHAAVLVSPQFNPGHGGNWASLSRVSQAFTAWPGLALTLQFTAPMDRESVERALSAALAGPLPTLYWSEDGRSLRFQVRQPPRRVNLNHLLGARDQAGRPVVGMLPAIWMLPDRMQAQWVHPQTGETRPGPDLPPGAREALLSPDGQWLLLKVEEPGQAAGQWQDRLWVIEVSRGDWRAVALTPGRTAWLPDGRLAVASGGTVHTWDPATAAVAPLPAGSPEPVWSGQALTETGDLLAGRSQGGEMLVIPRNLSALD